MVSDKVTKQTGELCIPLPVGDMNCTGPLLVSKASKYAQSLRYVTGISVQTRSARYGVQRCFAFNHRLTIKIVN